MARKFLYFIAICTILVCAAALFYRLRPLTVSRLAFTPSADFTPLAPKPANAWADRAMWLARPDIANSPSEWTPPGISNPATRPAAIFFIHPTTYLNRAGWNAPLDDARANQLAEAMVRTQATAFTTVGQVWAPRYRQATFGAFLVATPQRTQALDAAYADVLASWDAFLAAIPPNQPIVIAGHSQGALHLLRLLKERVAGQPIAHRIVAAYAVGWPVSIEADLPALGLPGCQAADQAGCLLSWQSFAEPADTSLIDQNADGVPGYTGKSRVGTRFLCVNPVTGTPDGVSSAADDQGVLTPSLDFKSVSYRAEGVPARCGGRGYLMIGAPPAGFNAYVMPGNNYHVFDYAMFWGSIRADIARRMAAFAHR